MNIIGEASLRISAITRDVGRTIQREVNEALKSVRAPKQNALTDLQRQINQGELNLANTRKAGLDAQRKATEAERALAAIRRNSKATAEQIAEAEEYHRRALLGVRVAVDRVNAAEEKLAGLRERLHRVNANVDRDNEAIRRSLSLLAGATTGVVSGLGKAVATGAKLGLVGFAAGGALAGVTSLTAGVLGLVAALGQAAGVAGLLPALLATKYAVLGAVKLATVGMGDAFKAVADGDAAKLEEALEKLSPAARQFVREVNKAKPAFDAMRLNVQEQMFAGLSGSVQGLAERYLPLANRLFTGVAKTLNGMARDVINFAMSAEALNKTSDTVNQIRSAFGTLKPAAQPAVQALLDIVHVGSTFLPQMFSGLSGGIQAFSARISEMAASGELAAFFQRAIDTVAQLGRILGNVGGTLSGVFQAANASGGGLLNTIEQITQNISEFVNSAQGQEALIGFFEAMRVVTAAVMPVITTLASIIGTVLAPILANLASTLGPPIVSFLEAFGRLLAAAAPLIDTLAATFGVLLEAFAPVLDIFAQAIQDVMPQLLPAITAIGEALVQLIIAATPLVPLFVQLVAALLPILPPILQLISVLIPPLIQLIQACLPAISALVQAFVAVSPILIGVAQVILAILIPPIKLIATVITAAIQVGSAIFQAFATVVSTVVGAIIGFLGKLAAIPGKVISYFARMKDGAIGVAVQLANWVAGLPKRILSALGNLGGMLLDAGKQIIMGLLNGLKSAVGAVIDWIKGLAGDLVDAALSALGIASPSKVFARIGRDVGRGLIVGLRDITPDVAEAADAMARSVIVTVSPGVSPPTLAGAPNIERAMAAVTAARAAGATTGGDGADTDAIADAIQRGMEGVEVVLSDEEVTSKVRKRDTMNRRR